MRNFLFLSSKLRFFLGGNWHWDLDLTYESLSKFHQNLLLRSSITHACTVPEHAEQIKQIYQPNELDTSFWVTLLLTHSISLYHRHWMHIKMLILGFKKTEVLGQNSRPELNISGCSCCLQILMKLVSCLYIPDTCRPPEYKNPETSRNLCIVRMSFSKMSEHSPKINPRPSESVPDVFPLEQHLPTVQCAI